MVRNRPATRLSRPDNRKAYALISRGSDGRLRFERFDNADAYRRRLKEISESTLGTVSIDDVVSLLDG